MKKIYLIILLLITVSCQSMDDAKKVLTNQKTNTTDEFLIKKRDPLTLPPDYDKLPEPGSNKETVNQKKIDNILKMKKENPSSEKNSLSLEKSILDKIRN